MFSTFKTYLSHVPEFCAQDYSHFIMPHLSVRMCVPTPNCHRMFRMFAIVYMLCMYMCACVYGKSVFLFIYKLFICAWTVCPSMCIHYYALLCSVLFRCVLCSALYISYALSKWILCKMLSYIIVIVRSVFVYGRPNSNNSSRRYILLFAAYACERERAWNCVCAVRMHAIVRSFKNIKLKCTQIGATNQNKEYEYKHKHTHNEQHIFPLNNCNPQKIIIIVPLEHFSTSFQFNLCAVNFCRHMQMQMRMHLSIARSHFVFYLFYIHLLVFIGL